MKIIDLQEPRKTQRRPALADKQQRPQDERTAN
jgi:hypothetical protein